MITAPVEKIVVHRAVKDHTGIRTQKVEIFYDLLENLSKHRHTFLSLLNGRRGHCLARERGAGGESAGCPPIDGRRSEGRR